MSEPKTDATQMEPTEEKMQNPGAPTTEQMLPHGSSVNIARKAKKKADGPLQILAGWLLDNQTGMSRDSVYISPHVSHVPPALRHRLLLTMMCTEQASLSTSSPSFS
jgi:hypothetical protein